MDIITLAHGSGGKATNELIQVFYKYFSNEYLKQQNDSSVLENIKGKIAVTTDSFVINPVFFNGGDIGKLSICGTVNDLAMSGAKALYITVGFIIEEGFLFTDLEKIVKSMADTAREAGVKIVAGDTKVVEKGSCDKIYINTTGIGEIYRNELYISGDNVKENDVVIISGTIGDHGVSIINERESLGFEIDIKSDCCILNHLIKEILDVSNKIKVLRDPTRGGVATTLNEIAVHSKVGFEILEEELPIKEEIKAFCEIVGFEPLYIANEGKVIIIVSEEDSNKVLEVIKKNEFGKDAKIIGKAIKDETNRVYLKTEIGGKRVLSMPEGELLVRIC